jgi:hypothetical protein
MTQCEAELGEFRRSLARLAEVGLDPYYPGKSLRVAAAEGKLTREMIDAYLGYQTARRRLLRCVREAFPAPPE